MTTTPKILYQTWKTMKLPPKFTKNRQKWLEYTQGWYHPLLTDIDLRNLVMKYTPQYLHAYDSFTENIERVDFARYVMMYLGGVYADLDTYPIKSIDKFINMNKIVLGKEPYEHANRIYSRKDVLCNAFMISPPKQKFWLDLMDFIVKNYEPNYLPVYNTGPMVMTLFMESLTSKSSPNLEKSHLDGFENVIITEPCVFFPLMGNGKITKGCNMDKDTYVVHEWENTWVTNPFKDPRWLNKRYWFYALAVVFILLYLYLYIYMEER